MPVRSKTSIFNAAMLRVGGQAATEGEGGSLWTALDANYPEIVRECFESGDGTFSFGRKRRELTSRQEGDFGYDDKYQLPTDAVHILEIYLSDVSCARLLEPWEIDGETNSLVVNARGRKVEVEYVAEGLEHTWSAGFALAIQRRLEAVIKDVLEEFGESNSKDQDADFHLMKASITDAKNRSARRVWPKDQGRLVRARRMFTRGTRG